MSHTKEGKFNKKNKTIGIVERLVIRIHRHVLEQYVLLITGYLNDYCDCHLIRIMQ